MKNVILYIIMILFSICSFSHIKNNDDLVETMTWILNNPQIDSLKRYEKKSNEITAWKLQNTNNPDLHLKNISLLLSSLKSYKFSNIIFEIYDYGDYIEKFGNDNYDSSLSEVYCVKGVLKYYNNLIKLDSKYRNEYLDKINQLSDIELSNIFLSE